MGKYRFIKPATAHYDLSDGDWVEFKRMLSIGDTLKIQSAGFSHVSKGGEGDTANTEIRVNWRETRLVRMLTWLSEWSFMTESGAKKKPINRENLEALDIETFGELETALDKHIEAMDLERTSPSGDSE